MALGTTNEVLAERAKTGDKVALDRLIKQNMGLVYMIAQKYTIPGVMLEDKVQDGCLGIIECLNTYDSSRSAFTTHAYERIKANILRSGNEQSQTIRIPVHVFEQRLSVNRFTAEFISENKRRPTIAEIVEGSGIPEVTVRNLHCTDAVGQPASIDASISVGDDEVNVAETYGGEWMEDALIKEQKYANMFKFIDELPDTERKLINCLYGLNGEIEHTMPMLVGKIITSSGVALSIPGMNSRLTLALTYLEDRAMGLNIPYEEPRSRKSAIKHPFVDPNIRDIIVVLSPSLKKAYITFDAKYAASYQDKLKFDLKSSTYAYLLDELDCVILQYTQNIHINNINEELVKCYNNVVSNGFEVLID